MILHGRISYKIDMECGNCNRVSQNVTIVANMYDEFNARTVNCEHCGVVLFIMRHRADDNGHRTEFEQIDDERLHWISFNERIVERYLNGEFVVKKRNNRDELFVLYYAGGTTSSYQDTNQEVVYDEDMEGTTIESMITPRKSLDEWMADVDGLIEECNNQ